MTPTDSLPDVTIWFPDVSNYTPVPIQAGTVVVIARATLSSSYADPHYQTFKRQAGDVGAFFCAYHWLNHGNIQAQAQWAYGHVGDTSLMLDCEDVAGNTGYAGAITTGDIMSFVDTYRALGGTIHMIYLPHWYWQDTMGSPSLSFFPKYDLYLCASEYRAYSDTNWPAAYGGVAPTQWQYTDSYVYGGQACDFNAYRGDVDGYVAMMSPAPVARSREEYEMQLPQGFAFDENQKQIDGGPIVADGLPTVAGGRGWLTFFTDFGQDHGVRLRVAIMGQNGWRYIEYNDLAASGGRLSIPLESGDQGYSVGRAKMSADDGNDFAPVGVLVSPDVPYSS